MKPRSNSKNIVTASCWWCLFDVCVVVLSSLVSVCLFAGRGWLVLCQLGWPCQSPGIGYKRVSVLPLPVSLSLLHSVPAVELGTAGHSSAAGTDSQLLVVSLCSFGCLFLVEIFFWGIKILTSYSTCTLHRICPA